MKKEVLMKMKKMKKMKNMKMKKINQIILMKKKIKSNILLIYQIRMRILKSRILIQESNYFLIWKNLDLIFVIKMMKKRTI